MVKNQQHASVLAITIDKRGIGFAVLQGPDMPIDWGTKESRINKHVVGQRHVESLISFFQPDVLVLRIIKKSAVKKRAEKLSAAIAALGAIKGLTVVRYDWLEVQDTFQQLGGGKKKYAIAKKIAEWRPELKAQQPQYRKLWQSENYSMAFFEAFALAITYYFKNT